MSPVKDTRASGLDEEEVQEQEESAEEEERLRLASLKDRTDTIVENYGLQFTGNDLTMLKRSLSLSRKQMGEAFGLTEKDIQRAEKKPEETVPKKVSDALWNTGREIVIRRLKMDWERVQHLSKLGDLIHTLNPDEEERAESVERLARAMEQAQQQIIAQQQAMKQMAQQGQVPEGAPHAVPPGLAKPNLR
jgi:hypothetical protein